MSEVTTLSTTQKVALAIAAAFYVGAGTLHFLLPGPYLRIMPPYIPWHIALVRVSGAFEIGGGLGLLLPVTRRAAAWGLVALLVTVFPANIYMAANPIAAGASSIPAALLWARLPMQVLLAWWVLWCTRGQKLLKRLHS